MNSTRPRQNVIVAQTASQKFEQQPDFKN